MQFFKNKQQEEGYNNLLKIVNEKEGKILGEYKTTKIDIELQCKEGHKFQNKPSNIKGGTWCPFCIKIRVKSKDNYLRFIQEKNGEALEEYKGAQTKIKIKCDKGHIWKTSPLNICRGNWCNICSHNNVENAKNEFFEILKNKNGEALEEYNGSKTKIKVKCDKGHIWETTPYIIKQNCWCTFCSPLNVENAKNKFLDYIKNKNGKVIGEYNGASNKIKIQCDKGHSWETKPSLLTSKKYWCRKCSNNCPKQAEESFIEIVKSRRGEVLGKYKNCDTKVEIKCEYGHIWSTSPSIIKDGCWCPTCSESHGERDIRLFLENNEINFKPQKPVIIDGIKLFFDFMCNINDLNIYIEFDGSQHFEFDEFFYNDIKEYEKREYYDYIKTLWAIKNDYHLIRIDHKNEKNINKILDNYFKNIDINDKLFFSDKIIYSKLIEKININ